MRYSIHVSRNVTQGPLKQHMRLCASKKKKVAVIAELSAGVSITVLKRFPPIRITKPLLDTHAHTLTNQLQHLIFCLHTARKSDNDKAEGLMKLGVSGINWGDR